MRNATEQFSDYLRHKNLLCTPQRGIILREVLQCSHHFDADELYERMRKKGETVSRATVYRTLPHLEQCGLLREVFRCQGRAKYERTLGHHDHMMCVRCGKVVEFRDDRIEKLQEEVCAGHHFEAIEHRMAVRGICRECQQQGRGKGKLNDSND